MTLKKITNHNNDNLHHNENPDKETEAHKESRNCSSSLGWSSSKHSLKGGTNDPGNEK